MRRLFLMAVLFSSQLLTQVGASPLPDSPHIYVEGSAEIKVVPDQMTISVGISDTNQQLAVAKQVVDERSRQLIGATKALDIASQDIATTALHVSPAHDYRNGEQVSLGTRVYRQVEITLRDLSKYSDLMAALVDAEISNTVNTQLEVSNQKQLSDKAMTAALEDARQRAESMALALGQRLERAHSVSEFRLRSDEPHQLFTTRGVQGDTGAMGEAAYRSQEPFEPGLIVTRAQVYVVFLLGR